MWTIEECSSYFFIHLQDAPNFCKLENFPTDINSIYETYYVVFSRDGRLPVLFPYGQRRYHCLATVGDTPLRAIYCPWKTLISALKEFEKKWEMQGKLILTFTPELFDVPERSRFPQLAYYLTPYPYGYVASVEQWAKLRKPNDFPVTSDWLYRTSYLTFQSKFSPKRLFFPHSVHGWTLTTDKHNCKRWRVLAEEGCDYLKPRVISQLRQDNWRHNGHFEVDFIGIDSLETNKDIVQFLFEQKSRNIAPKVNKIFE